MCDSSHTVWVTLGITIRVKIRERVIGWVRDRTAANVRRKALGVLAEVAMRMAVGVLVVMDVLVAVGEFLAVGVLMAVTVLVPVGVLVAMGVPVARWMNS